MSEYPRTSTPRTNAAERNSWEDGLPDLVVASGLSRQLEIELAGASARLQAFHDELSQVMPPDFKDWWENSKDEWPLVARVVIEGLREREAAVSECLDREITAHNALKEDVGKCHDVLGESRDSDSSELHKFFEGRKQLHTQLLTAEVAASDAARRLCEAFKIIEVLHMDALDNNQESWPRATAWLEHNKIFNPSNQPKEDHEKN